MSEYKYAMQDASWTLSLVPFTAQNWTRFLKDSSSGRLHILLIDLTDSISEENLTITASYDIIHINVAVAFVQQPLEDKTLGSYTVSIRFTYAKSVV